MKLEIRFLYAFQKATFNVFNVLLLGAVASSGLYGCKSKKTWHTAKVQAPFFNS